MKVGLIFGGMSNEKDISIKSCECIYKEIDKNKYDVTLIYMDSFGNFHEVENTYLENKKIIENVFEFLKSFDVIFPVLHGKYGEDGTVQGMLEILKIKYVGCNVLSSSICMDKVFTKYVFEKAGFNQAKYEWIKYKDEKVIYVDKNLEEQIIDFDNLELIISNNLKYPVYVKPSNSGSSIGISKVNDKNELLEGIKLASSTDEKIIFEEEIIGRELEVAILESDELIVSEVGEILTDNNFYDFDKKYNNFVENTCITKNLSDITINKLQKSALKAFNAVSANGLSRVDFFLKDDKIYINEINTMPGFTAISMYPKLFENKNLSITELIDILIASAQ